MKRKLHVNNVIKNEWHKKPGQTLRAFFI